MSTFATRVIVQTAGFFILFALIFLAAGTIHYWQGWLFCFSFYGSSVAIGLYFMKRDPALLERRMRFGPGAEPRPSQKIIIAISLAMFLVLLIVSALDHRFGWSRVPPGVSVVGNILIIASFAGFVGVLRENTFAASTIRVERGQRVISTGPYAHVRHPMYAGGLLLIFAIPLALGSLWGLLVAAFSVPIMVARILDEEQALCAELAGYDDYRLHVRYRLIPLVW
jgi:protein-S-isoprenylcysteine O-methyltransferase Ste14